MKFSDITEDQWVYIKCFLPPQPRVGRKRAEDKKTINGILYVLETGCKWEYLFYGTARSGLLYHLLEKDIPMRF